MIRRGAIVAGAVVVVVNLWALAGVALDRAGQPDAVVTLDERELALVAPEGDTSAVRLRFRYQDAAFADVPPRDSTAESGPGARVLDQARLEDLGFDCSMSPANVGAPAHYQEALPRPALVVFAIGGPDWEGYVSAWQAWRLQQIEKEVAGGTLAGDAERRARAEIESAASRASRLWPIDAGRDLEVLRARHADASRVVILRGVVRLHLAEVVVGSGPVLHGHVSEVFPLELSVPAALAGPLEALREPPRPGRPAGRRPSILGWDPRYQVRLAAGRALRPWVLTVRRVP